MTSIAGKIVEREGRKAWQPESPSWWRHCLSKFKPDEKVTVTLASKKPKRSIRQNSFYWAYLTLISEDTGHSPEELHEWAKGKCLPSKVKEILGDPVRVKKSTTELNKSGFTEFIKKISVETGIAPPDPKAYYLEDVFGPEPEIEYPEDDGLEPTF